MTHNTTRPLAVLTPRKNIIPQGNHFTFHVHRTSCLLKPPCASTSDHPHLTLATYPREGCEGFFASHADGRQPNPAARNARSLCTLLTFRAGIIPEHGEKDGGKPPRETWVTREFLLAPERRGSPLTQRRRQYKQYATVALSVVWRR